MRELELEGGRSPNRLKAQILSLQKIVSPKQDVATKSQNSDSSNASSNQLKVNNKEQTADMNSDSAADSAPLMEDSLKIPYDYGREVMSLSSSEDPNVQTWTSP